MSLLPPLSTNSAKFDVIGKTYTGRLVEIGDEHQASTFDPNGPGKPAFWDDEKTRPKMQRRFVIQGTPDPSVNGDDGVRAVYAVIDGKDGSLYRAIYDAIKNASALGGTLTVTFTGTDPLSKNPANPRKLYSAVYVDATPGQILGGNPAPAPAAPAPAAAPAAPAGPPPGIDPAAWAAMPAATQAAILAATAGTDQPPF